MGRVEEFSKRKGMIDKWQCAGKNKCSNLQIAWLIKEYVIYNVEKGKTIYVGILDAKKAYDTVFQNGLYYKLFYCSIHSKR